MSIQRTYLSAMLGGLVVIVAVSGVFFVHRVRSSQRAHAEVAAWDRVECAIVSSEVDEPGAGVAWEAYRFRVAYRYSYAGKQHQCPGSLHCSQGWISIPITASSTFSLPSGLVTSSGCPHFT